MQNLMAAITVTAGMAFSLAIAILVEEWIFGKVFGRDGLLTGDRNPGGRVDFWKSVRPVLCLAGSAG